MNETLPPPDGPRFPGALPALCVICHFYTEADDVKLPDGSGRCICVRCYHRNTETTLSMGKRYRHEIEAILAGLAAYIGGA